MVRRLRAPDGPRRRAPRPHEPGDPRGAVDRLPPARAAGGARGPGEALRHDLGGARGGGPGEVWEEDEFWIELSWRIDPDGALGIRKWFESPYRPGEKLTVDEYYGWMFEHSVPGLPAAAAKEGLTPLAYMRKRGAFLIEEGVYRTHETVPGAATLEGTAVDPTTRRDHEGGRGGRRRGRRPRLRRVPHAVAQARVLLEDPARLEVAGVRAARPTSGATSTGPRWTARRTSSCSCRRSGCPP